MTFAEELKEKTTKTLNARLGVIGAIRKEIATHNLYGPEFHTVRMSLL